MINRISPNSSNSRPSVPTAHQQTTSSSSSPFIPPTRKVLSPGEWARAVSGSDAPFGFDRMPTVFG